MHNHTSTLMNEANYTELPDSLSSVERYEFVYQQAKSLISEETDLYVNCANICSLLFHTIPSLNWCGWYFKKEDELVVGPFQGKPACTRIALGKGVCGTAAAEMKTIVVEDVHRFDGHIACDPSSRSEIVVPLLLDSTLIAVLDIDSPIPARFGNAEVLFFERITKLVCTMSVMP